MTTRKQNDYNKGREFNAMGADKQESTFQCQVCGDLHTLKTRHNIDSELFITAHCPKCRGETKHLWCGDGQDVYIYYNLNIDPRYYYNTK